MTSRISASRLAPGTAPESGRAGIRLFPIMLLLAACSASPASAQVFEVGSDGVKEVGSAPRKPASRLPPPAAWAAAAAGAAARHGVSPALVDAVARQESGYRADAVSRKGAIGVMQLMPETARALGVDPRDALANIEGGALYLRQLLDRFGGRIDLTLAAYNAGPGAVERYGGVPPFRETQAYVAAGLRRLASQSLVPPATSGAMP